MKITHCLPPASVEQPPGAVVPRTPAEGEQKGAPGRVAAHGATVELSPIATSLRTAAAPAEFDGAKVERIAQRIAEGRFEVNAEAIADKLIANAQELLGKVQR